MNKIYNDLNESEYFFKYDDLIFYFSSKFYLNKFKSEYINFIKEQTNKLVVKFKCNIIGDEMMLLLLYRKIEKRGFKVTYNNVDITDKYSFKISWW